MIQLSCNFGIIVVPHFGAETLSAPAFTCLFPPIVGGFSFIFYTTNKTNYF